jgi:signal peptidase II
VLDFIQVGHSGIFNLGDQCVTAGVLTVMVQLLRGVPLAAAPAAPTLPPPPRG